MLALSFPEINERVDRLYSAHFADLSQKEEGKLEEHVTLLLLDFYVSWIENTNQAIFISLNKNAYKAKSRFNAPLHIWLSEALVCG